jgi:hypothetical protein
VFDVYANVQGSDLGRVSDKVTKIVNEFRPKPAAGSTITVRGQVESMNTGFGKLGLGLIFAAVLIYFLMVVNFQSWTDPFIIITALPGAFAGILWMLFLTHATFNVESVMGAIMSIGVATANSILMITFANEQLRDGKTCARRRDSGRSHATASCVDDRTRHDHRHGADGARSRRRRRTKCAPRSRGHRRSVTRDCRDTFFVPVVFSVIRHKMRPRKIEDDVDLAATQLELATQH